MPACGSTSPSDVGLVLSALRQLSSSLGTWEGHTDGGQHTALKSKATANTQDLRHSGHSAAKHKPSPPSPPSTSHTDQGLFTSDFNVVHASESRAQHISPSHDVVVVGGRQLQQTSAFEEQKELAITL